MVLIIVHELEEEEETKLFPLVLVKDIKKNIVSLLSLYRRICSFAGFSSHPVVKTLTCIWNG
jgi:hypothetical protein